MAAPARLSRTHISPPRAPASPPSQACYTENKKQKQKISAASGSAFALPFSHMHIRISPPSSPLSPSSQACYGRQCLRQYFFFPLRLRAYTHIAGAMRASAAELSLTRRQGKRATSICVSQYWYFCAQVKASESSTSSRLSAAKVKRATSY